MTVLVNILRLVAVLAWLAAAVYLGAEKPDNQDALRIVSAVIVGFPGAIALAATLGRFVTPSAQTRERIKHTLQAALVDIYREGSYQGDLTRVSLHVWMVPLWFRTLFPYRVRKVLRRDGLMRRLPVHMRLSIVRLAIHRFEHHEPSGVTFRRGIGLVGRCIEENNAGQVVSVRLDTKQFKDALAKDNKAWWEEKETIHQNLKRADAKKIAATYSQAAALVLREESGEAIGCITLELPPDSKVHFRASKTNPLLKHLRTAGGHVQNQLRR